MELSCAICIVDYDTINKVPKMLTCGHTICMICLPNIIQSNLKCPICRKVLTEREASKYPNNFALLSLIENSEKKPKDLSKIIPTLVPKAKDTLKSLINELNEKQDELNEKQEVIKRIEKNIEILETPELAQDELSKVVKGLQHELSVIIGTGEGLPNITLNLKDFRSKNDFLNQINERLKRNEKMYITHEVNGITKYGKLARHDDYNAFILVHCLYKTQIPATQCVLLKFDDLKHAMPLGFPQAFLATNDESGITEIDFIDVEGTACGRAFIRQCTGELGSSYIGCRHYCDSNYPTDAYNMTFRKSDSDIEVAEYFVYRNENKYYDIKKWKSYVVKLEVGGDFKIVKYDAHCRIDHSTLIGVVTNTEHERAGRYVEYDGNICYNKMMVDCGVVFSVQ